MPSQLVWLLAGAALVLVVMGAGFWLGFKVGRAPVLLVRERNSHLLAELEELLAQGEAGRLAATGVVRAERRIAGAAGMPLPDALRVLHPDGWPPAAPSGDA